MNRFINLDGTLTIPEQGVDGLDTWAYRYGFGLFETMLSRAGVIRNVGFHWERLEAGMRLLKMPFPKNYRDLLQEEIIKTQLANGISGTSRIRLQVSAGHGSFLKSDQLHFSFLIECTQWNENSFSDKKAIRIGISSAQKHAGPYAHLKSCNALPYVLAAREADENKWDDALLLNEHNRIVESAIANIFWLEDGIVLTPALSEGCVDGTMRRHLLELLPEKGSEWKTGTLTKNRLMTADGVFLTNALRGIMPVSEIDGKQFSVSAITALAKAFNL